MNISCSANYTTMHCYKNNNLGSKKNALSHHVPAGEAGKQLK